jgi:hypothetical protein
MCPKTQVFYRTVVPSAKSSTDEKKDDGNDENGSEYAAAEIHKILQ